VLRAVLCIVIGGIAVSSTPARAEQAAPDSVWTGTLQMAPAGPRSDPVNVRVVLGPLPQRAGECATWHTTYERRGDPAVVKPYRLCRSAAPEAYVIDEGNGIQLAARRVDNTLFSTYRIGTTVFVTQLRWIGERIEQELSVFEPAADTGAVVSLVLTSRQYVVLRRAR
jgi:hypothetical protein